MKKINTVLTMGALIAPLLLTSCNQQGSSSNSSDNTHENIIATNLEKMKKGFALTGVITQTREEIDLDTGNLTGKKENNVYNTDLIYESDGENGFHRHSYQKVMNEVVDLENFTYFADENNDVFYQQLNHKNEIDNVYLSNGDESSSSFDVNGYYNWASLLNNSDLVYDEIGNRYELNNEKANFIASLMLSYLNAGFYDVATVCYFTVDSNYVFNSFNIVMNSRKLIEYDENNTMHFYKVDNKVEFAMSDVGTAKVNRIVPFETKQQNQPLTTAFDKFGDNMTIKITDTKKSLSGSSTSKTYQKLYLDGESIYVANFNTLTGENQRNEKDFLLKQDPASEKLYSYVYNQENGSYEKQVLTEYPSIYQGLYFYDELLPTIKGVSQDLFTYNATKNNYENEDLALKALVQCFNITRPPFRNPHILNANKVSVRLNADNTLNYVEFEYSYMSLTDIENGTVKVEFSNVGSTEIPFEN